MSVADLVAAAGTLPRQVVYTDHRCAAPGCNTAVLVFRPLPPEPAEASVRPSPGGKPSPAPERVPDRVFDTVAVRPGWVPDIGAA